MISNDLKISNDLNYPKQSQTILKDPSRSHTILNNLKKILDDPKRS